MTLVRWLSGCLVALGSRDEFLDIFFRCASWRAFVTPHHFFVS
jgi:hypothetical protein